MDTVAFARGVPAPEMLPVEQLRSAVVTAFDSNPSGVLAYGTGAGWLPLRERLAARHGVDVNRVVVTTGSLQGFDLLVQAIVRRAAADGRPARVIVEQPTYDRPLLLLERMGVEIVPVPLDHDGVDVEALDDLMADGADFAYLIPTFQNPSGATLTLERRNAVIASMRRHGVPVLEDDPYGLLHFDRPAPATLLELAGGDPLLWYSSSTSKTVAPGLRVGWLILPEVLAAEVSTIANDTYISSALLSQATLDAYFAAGAFEPWIEHTRGLLLERRDHIVAALASHLPDATYSVPEGGYFLWLRLPFGLDGREVAAAGTNLGVSLVPGASFGAGCEPFVRIAFSSPPVEHIDLGVRRLAGACAAATPATTP